jgi:hypothetical protein
VIASFHDAPNYQQSYVFYSDYAALKPDAAVIGIDMGSASPRPSELRQLVEEVVHSAEDRGFIGTEDVVIGVGQTDHFS